MVSVIAVKLDRLLSARASTETPPVDSIPTAGNFGQPQQQQQQQQQPPQQQQQQQQQASSEIDLLGGLSLGGPSTSAPTSAAPSDPFGGNLLGGGPTSQPSAAASKSAAGGLDDLLGDFGSSSAPKAPEPKGPPPDLGTLNVALSDIQPGPHPPAQVYDKKGLKVRRGGRGGGRGGRVWKREPRRTQSAARSATIVHNRPFLSIAFPQVIFHFAKGTPHPDITVVVVSFLNFNSVPVNNLEFQAAVPKVRLPLSGAAPAASLLALRGPLLRPSPRRAFPC